MFHDDHSDRLWSRSSIETYKYGSKTYPISGYLFFVEATTGGVKLGNLAVGEDKYLANTSASLDNLGNFTAAGSVWAFERSPLNATGLLVKDVSGGTKYWGHDVSFGYNYIHLENLGKDDKDFYIWRFIGIDELKADAEELGVSASVYEGLDGSDEAHFKTLVEAIASAKASAALPTIADGKYLLVNRRHNLYLDGGGMKLTGVGSPTSTSIWTLSTVGGVRSLTNAALDRIVCVTTTPAYGLYDNDNFNQSYNVSFVQSSDKDPRFVAMSYPSGSNTYYFSLANPDEQISARTKLGLSAEWMFVPVEEYLQEVGLLEQDVTAFPDYLTDLSSISETAFYRLQNAARSYNYYTEDYAGRGGWLEDVDHQHIRADLGNTNAELAKVQAAAGSSEFYSAERDMSHASALWQFIVVSHAADGSEEPTGVLATEHNIYILRNANTGKYIKKGFNEVGGLSFHQETTEKSEAQPFFITELATGEFAFMEYNSTNSSGIDQNNGALAIEGVGTGYRAGLTRAAAAQSGTGSAWHILPAPTIRLNFVNRAADNNTADNWTTFYYPFDAVPQAADAEELEIYAGAWIKDDVQIAMVRMQDVPAGNAVMVRSAVGGHYFLNIYPAGSDACSQTDDDFEGSCWRGLVESEGNQYNGLPARYDNDWRNYWILGTNKNKDIRLLHPAGDWLLPNRAYLDAVTTESTPSSVSMFVYFFDDRVTSVRDALRLIDDNHAGASATGLYDLQGRRVEGTPRTGVYIQGGKKIYIR